MKLKNGILTLIFACALMFSNSYMVLAKTNGQRFAGSNRYETAVQISQNGWSSSNYVIIATGEGYADSLCAVPLSKKYQCPILLTQKDSLNSSVIKEIKRLGAKNAIIVGGEGVVSRNINSTLQSNGINTRRIFGMNRYETSVKIAKEIPNVKEVTFATGQDFPDALSIASIAAIKGMPIILINRYDVPDVVMKYVKSLKVSKSFVIGGYGVISDGNLKKLPKAQRIEGKNRYETNKSVLSAFSSMFDFSTMCVATGDDFPDALTGAAYAAKRGMAVALVDKNDNYKMTTYIKERIGGYGSLIVFGGVGNISRDMYYKMLGQTKPKAIVCIDPGHGGYDSGAVGPSGSYEKNISLSVALKAGKILEQNGIKVVYTRKDDNVSWSNNIMDDLQTRCDIAEKNNASYYVSIHCNSADAKEANGIETYYFEGSSKGEQLASEIQKELIKETGAYNRNVKFAHFYVIKNTDCPASLAEIGFISNPEEEKLLNSSSYQQKCAKAIANGVLNCINKNN